jgi:hypothetical protein
VSAARSRPRVRAPGRLIGLAARERICVGALLAVACKWQPVQGEAPDHAGGWAEPREVQIVDARSKPLTTVPADTLQGPLPSLEDELIARLPERDYTCPPRDDEVESDVIRETARWIGKGALLEARLVRTRSDIACAPIEYCTLAIRTTAGWWLTPFEEASWCEGVTGPSNGVSTTDEVLYPTTDGGDGIVHRGVRRRSQRSDDMADDGSRVESWAEDAAPFARRCGLEEGSVVCRWLSVPQGG